MTPEERFERIERQLEFLAQNQALLAADLGSLSHSVGSLTLDSASVKRDLVELARIVQQHVVTTEARFQMVAGQFQRVDKSLESLAEAQRATEERLNTLITVVERYFSNGKH